MADGSDRLPWLDEPRSQPAPRRRSLWLPLILLLVLLAAVGVLFWTALRNRQAAPEIAAIEQPAPLPPLEAPPPPPAEPEIPPEPVDISSAETLPQPPALERSRQAVRAIRQSVEAEQEVDPVDALVEQEEALAAADVEIPILPPEAPALVRPTPVVVRTPAQRWGRKLQLGAYRNPAQAETAWRALVRRYPYLASKPKLVTPIEVRSTDGRATRMYRLQLAAASQAQAVVICQRLERAGQSCVVVY